MPESQRTLCSKQPRHLKSKRFQHDVKPQPLIRKQTLSYLVKLACNYLNVNELLTRNIIHIWNLSDFDGSQAHNHLVLKRVLNHLAKLPNLASFSRWLSVPLRSKWLWVRAPLKSINFSVVHYLFKKTVPFAVRFDSQ